LAAAGIAPADVDLIVVATTTPDMIFPSTACILQAKLGARNGPAFDVQAVCSGFVYALNVADAMVKSGAVRNALVVGAEIYSRILDWNDRGTCVLFGDGAGAVVLVPSTTPGSFPRMCMPTDYRAFSACLNSRERRGERRRSYMDGSRVQVCSEGAGRGRTRGAGCQQDAGGATDWLVPHQANVHHGCDDEKARTAARRMVSTVALRQHIGGVDPLALDAAVRDGRIRSGHHVCSSVWAVVSPFGVEMDGTVDNNPRSMPSP
jgi:3-oxoacyl-[acyl-carrier-protein] synthase-3